MDLSSPPGGGWTLQGMSSSAENHRPQPVTPPVAPHQHAAALLQACISKEFGSHRLFDTHPNR